MCLSHLIYIVWPCLIHTCHAAPMPCFDHAQHGRLSTAVLCRGLEKNGMVGAWHGRGVASVYQTRPHCINQMGKTHSKPLAARHGRGTAWARPATCESALRCYPSGWGWAEELKHFTVHNCVLWNVTLRSLTEQIRCYEKRRYNLELAACRVGSWKLRW